MKLLSRRPKSQPLRAGMDGAGFRSDELVTDQCLKKLHTSLREAFVFTVGRRSNLVFRLLRHFVARNDESRRASYNTGLLHELKLMALARRASFTFLLILALAGCKTMEAPHTTNVSTVSGVYHYVKSGETLWSISKLYDIDIQNILSANNIHDTTYVTRGQRLLIPGAYRRPEKEKTFSYSDSFVWPLRGAVISYFGSKMDRTRNKGIDIKAGEGSSVKAAKAGKVVFCDEWLKGFGKTVILDHGDNSQTVYAYNSMILVKPGDLVEQNSVIAKVGRGGRAKEPSLHFEIRKNGEPQNPFYYLSN